MEFREKIEEKLKEIDSNIHYGKVTFEEDEEITWDYIVFGKNKLRKSDPKSIDLQDSYWVAICRENYIPDDTVLKVITKLQEIPGLKLASEDGNYEYVFKKNTNLVVEILVLVFTKTLKCGNLDAIN